MKQILWIVALLAAPATYAQTGQFIKDSRHQCLIWDEDYSPKDSVTWTGSCKNGHASGTGILTWYQDNKTVGAYTGIMADGKPNGQGTYVIPGYATLKGTFADGVLHGKGAAYFENGGKTIGNFVKGNFLNLDDKYLALLKKYDISQDSTDIYVNDNGAGKLFYYTLVPQGKINAVLILFPSTGETAENVISCNKALMQQAWNNHILTVVVSANYNKGLETDQPALTFFEAVFKDLIIRFKAPKDKFILSGLSLGGENALQYTEMSRNQKYNTLIKPLATIGIDPPVDMADLYYNAQKQIPLYEKEGAALSESKKLALTEAHFLMDYFHIQYGGSPDEFPEKYIAASQFSRNQEDGGNAKYLVDVPVRLYCDPDIVWQLKNKARDYYTMNAANLSAMANFLMQHGSTKVEFIPAVGKGFRVDGTRHPHSWSIVDADDCIRWILQLAK
ncbi:MORN repeat-containing protein [Chitinophaga pinensis]|uniref:MORN repeat protein n=1 Tax=Chitinophaga pinensis (strain ATCC 43595 / DSM 2588 / LMG 13176 / NBRC 15968 / NCIMB 11800 / UQM 2034) TaxID=485918 RepID=A0A979GQ12_CHIPD|nr:hypothetical protein [Chitinophaga pinensis]ACU59598.1 hypothetical protein Cpin_2105 [Chitinophaga pinensis DSM 2588]